MPQTTLGTLQVAYDERVLAPRPWTLAQSEWAAELWEAGPGGRVLELCSGVGHIGLALATRVPAELVMVDANPVACSFAGVNARAAGLGDRVDIRFGPLEASLDPEERFAVILADPPWVPTGSVQHFPEDPPHAIDGGPDGMSLVRACLDVISRHLTDDGDAVVQVGPGQETTLAQHLLSQPALCLAVSAARSFGTRGALVHLRRTAAVPSCGHGDRPTWC